MGELKRFGVSMDAQLLDEFDDFIERKGYPNRSEALRDLVKEALVAQSIEQQNKDVAGTITLLYPYGVRLRHINVAHSDRLTILANLQVHLDEQTCLKVLVVRGRAQHVQTLADHLLGTKGVWGQLTLSASERVDGIWHR